MNWSVNHISGLVLISMLSYLFLMVTNVSVFAIHLLTWNFNSVDMHFQDKDKDSGKIILSTNANYSLIAFDERVTFWLQRVWSLPCACAYVALFARRLAYNHYAIAHAYNAANAHAQGSDRARWSQKVSLVEGNRSIDRSVCFLFSLWVMLFLSYIAW